MKRRSMYKLMQWVWVVVFLFSTAGAAVGAPVDPPFEQMNVWGPISVYDDPTPLLRHIPVSEDFTRMSRLGIQSATLHINYRAAGEKDRSGNTCLAWPPEAMSAFEYAVDIWETLITSSVPIEIAACWTDSLPTGVLGQSGTDNNYRNFDGAPQLDTWYPTALANALHGSRMSGSTVDMHISYASTFNWYFGTDGKTPSNQTDFASIVLHEVGHGLGFAGSMTVSSGYGYWAWGTSNPSYQYPASYDHFAQTGGDTLLLDLGNGTTALGNALVSENVYFNGAYATAANGGTPPELYAPAEWRQGSSYSHLDESFNTSNGGRDSLMTWSFARGESIHSAGPVTMGVLKDVGWALVGGGGGNTAPTLSVPDISMAINTTRSLDLWGYASDSEDDDSALTFTLVSVSDADLGATLSGHTLSIAPASGWTGTATVEIRVSDSGGLAADDAFEVTVAGGGNTAPTLSISDVSLNVNENTSLDLWNSADDNEDADSALIFTVENASTGIAAELDSDGHTLHITPALDWTGEATVGISVRDTGGLTADDTFAVTVSGGGNTAPTLSIPDLSMAAGATLTLDLRDYASDAEDSDDSLTFAVGFNFDPALTVAVRDTYFLDITSSASWSGGSLVEVDVSDTGGLTGYSMFWVELSGGGAAPTLSVPDISLDAGENGSLDLQDYAADDDDFIPTLTFTVVSVSDASLDAELDGDGHTLYITPASGWTGSATVELRVTDPGGLSGDDTFVVYVGGGGNTAPTLDIPNVSLALDASTTLDLREYAEDAEDADADLVFTVGDTYDSELTAVIRDGHFLDITSSPDWWGFTFVTVNVSDPGGLTAYDMFWVELGGGGGTAPTLDIPDVLLDLNESRSLDLRIYAADNQDGDDDLFFMVDDVSVSSLTAEIDSDGYTLNLTPAAGWSGVATVEVSVFDLDFESTSVSFDVTVGELYRVCLPMLLR